MKILAVHDNGGRRSGFDRRQFAYAVHIPERRNGDDRRIGGDRRLPRDLVSAVQPDPQGAS
jgi:hypothetical protein